MDGIDHIKIKMTDENIQNWFVYHLENLPIEHQISPLPNMYGRFPFHF